jgi:ankyrin repeat protein
VAGKYGTDPIDAAISTQDVDLFRELMSKGLDLRRGCPAEWASQVALNEGGDLMLKFLLENGMQLGCLRDPPLHTFLRMGIATDSYPADRAIRVAEVLVKNGASVNQRDSQGKSIFDVLDRAKSAPRIAPLREVLTKMADQARTS